MIRGLVAARRGRFDYLRLVQLLRGSQARKARAFQWENPRDAEPASRERSGCVNSVQR